MTKKRVEIKDDFEVLPLDVDNSINLKDKEEIQKLKFTINNLIKVVNNAYHQISPFLDQLRNKNYCLVLAIGNTGCGKSTMFTSLIDGPESLE